MDKIEKMAQLVRDYEKASNGAETMFELTEESGKAFDQMWDYAKNNGFVNPFTETLTDRPVIKIYANYGVLSHEKETVFTYANNVSEIYDEIYIEIPEKFKVYGNDSDTEILLSANDGYDYTVDELIKNIGDVPSFVYVGKDGGYRTIKCKVLDGMRINC